MDALISTVRKRAKPASRYIYIYIYTLRGVNKLIGLHTLQEAEESGGAHEITKKRRKKENEKKERHKSSELITNT